MRFRKKPVIIEAVRWIGINHNEMEEFLGGKSQLHLWGDTGQYLIIFTLEGRHQASIGDWIIKGVQDEFYPIKPDIFERTYEPITHQEAGDTPE